MTPLRRAWRVEHSVDGYGPWWNDRPAWNAVDYSEHPGRMPMLCADTWLRGRDCEEFKPPCWRFAFPDVRTMCKWICEKAQHAGHENGFHVRVYGVGWQHHSYYKNQIVFDPSHAVSLRTLSLLDIPLELERDALRRMAA